MYDVCIIGGGVIGAAIARDLSRYNIKVVLCEKGEDVAVGATKANSAIVHGGYTSNHGTLKGEMSIRGNRQYDQLNQELNFGLKRIGSLVLAFDENERPKLDKLLENGEKNGVRGLKIVNQKDLRELEPGVGLEAQEALYCPETAITSPYEFCIALMENAITNGVELRLHTEVADIQKTGGHFRITTRSRGTNGNIETAMVVNAAGVYSDYVANMVGDTGFEIHPRQGQYLLFRRGQGELVKHVVFQTPTSRGKGILVTPTYWGNLMIGPNSEELSDRENLSTNRQILRYIVRTAERSIPALDLQQVIRTFSGIRASSTGRDFILKESAVAPGFIHAAGIDSPGLTSSPAIARRVTELLEKAGLELEKKNNFHPERRGITSPFPLKPMGEIKELIDLPEGNPNRIVCRCEQVTESTIIDALNRGIPIDSTDAVKRRTRAGMGACQGHFCTSRVVPLIARETGLKEDMISTRGPGSGILPERVDPRELRGTEF